MRPQISREGARSPAHARRKRADVSSAPLSGPAATCGAAALAAGHHSAVPARLPRERAPGSPRGPEPVPASSGRAGPKSPEGPPREVSPATPLSAPLPPPSGPRPFHGLPAAAHASLRPPFPGLGASGAHCPSRPPSQPPRRPRRVAEPECHRI